MARIEEIIHKEPRGEEEARHALCLRTHHFFVVVRKTLVESLRTPRERGPKEKEGGSNLLDNLDSNLKRPTFA